MYLLVLCACSYIINRLQKNGGYRFDTHMSYNSLYTIRKCLYFVCLPAVSQKQKVLITLSFLIYIYEEFSDLGNVVNIQVSTK